MLTTTPEPDGRIAIYLHGTLKGRARNQEHADDWCRRYLDLLHQIAPVVWAMGDEMWAAMTPEQRQRLREPVQEAA